tara:strand:+ start:448 stop:1200 length:753 start_codon:yes stop_codon:yes gene_type:complete
MLKTRRINNTRWWNNKRLWFLIIFIFLIAFVRFSKSLIYRDIYYFFSKPFWPGQFQREILLDSYDKELNIKLKQLERDNLRLRSLLSLKKTSDELKIDSSVISRITGSWWRKIILNKGARNGVKIGDAVVGPGGLLGLIDDVSSFTSSVKLLTSSESQVGAWVERINIHGLLIGVGNDTPKLVFYSKNIDIKVGDFILSSPASTLLPPNIPIGIIESIEEDLRLTTTAKVQLLANPQAIDWVQILKTKIQ